jgi:hypothetical protein
MPPCSRRHALSIRFDDHQRTGIADLGQLGMPQQPVGVSRPVGWICEYQIIPRFVLTQAAQSERQIATGDFGLFLEFQQLDISLD